jgi:hypothetical protein
MKVKPISKNIIDRFIDKFKERHPHELEDVFYNGYCYHFAKLLQERFGGAIIFNNKKVHFALWIYHHIDDEIGNNGDVYDIKGRGIIKDSADWWLCDDYIKAFPDEAKEIKWSCINKNII